MNSNTKDIQQERSLWFDSAFDAVKNYRGFPSLLSSHAPLIEIDIRIAFCAGAWISTIVLACAAVEAKFRQIDSDDFKTKSETLFGENADLRWLREIRNELMHSKAPGSPSLVWMVEGHDLGKTQSALEDDAKRAIEIMFQTLYRKK